MHAGVDWDESHDLHDSAQAAAIFDGCLEVALKVSSMRADVF